MSESFFPQAPIGSDEVPGIKGALTRYRVLAWIVGTLLVLLICVGMPLKYLAGNEILTSWVGVAHGWLFMFMVLAAIDLGRRVRWSIKWYAAIIVAGLLPFLTFVAEHFATKDVRRRVASVAEEAAGIDVQDIAAP